MGLDLALGDGIVHGSDGSTVDLEFVTTMSLLSFSWERGREGREREEELGMVFLELSIRTLKCHQDTTILCSVLCL